MCEANLRARGQPGENSSGLEYSVMSEFEMITVISAERKHYLSWKPNLSQPLISNDLLLLALSLTFTGMYLVVSNSLQRHGL